MPAPNEESNLPELEVTLETLPDGLTSVTVELSARHFEYLEQRAEHFGESPEAHLARILREFRSYHDTHRPEQRQAAQPGSGAITGRR
jgi:hypothetical protein